MSLTISYVFNLMMLGILLSQVWHWATWTKKERPFIRVVVVRKLPFAGWDTDDTVVGDFLLFRFDYLLHGLVLPIVCGSLRQIRSIR